MPYIYQISHNAMFFLPFFFLFCNLNSILFYLLFCYYCCCCYYYYYYYYCKVVFTPVTL